MTLTKGHTAIVELDKQGWDEVVGGVKMKRSRLRALSLFVVLGVSAVACGHDPVKPVPTNHNPIVSSLVLFPAAIGSSDSAIAVCTASDPDGDSLVYDWISDGRLDLKDAPRVGYIYSSPRNWQVFYRGTIVAPNDTALIWCYTRDLRGGQAGVLTALILHP